VDVEIRFNRAAFRHKVTKADILRAFETFIYEDPIEDAENKYLLLGFNIHGNLIEVMYNRINENAVNVFHAMPCRRAFRDMIEE
jgi:D-alanine-D-alanine ligase-like ATP-grasp enzyme